MFLPHGHCSIELSDLFPFLRTFYGVITHSSCETCNHRAVTIFFYLEDIKFSSVSLNIVSKQEILKVTTYLAHITNIAF